MPNLHLLPLGFVIGVLVGSFFASRKNVCVCSDCRRARWNLGEKS